MSARRLFIAVDVSAAAPTLSAEVDRLARRASTHHIAVNWVPAADVHLTLKYLGWAREEAIEAIADRLVRAASVPPFPVRLAGLGAFPHVDSASALWAGVEGQGCDSLMALAASVEAHMTDLGFAAEKRPYFPHVTLGRLPESRGIGDLIGHEKQMFSDLVVEGLDLYESQAVTDTSVASARYKRIRKIPFLPPKTAFGRQGESVERQHRTPNDELNRIDTDDGWPKGQGPNVDPYEPFRS